MKDNIQPCEVIESNLLDPTKETEAEFAEPIWLHKIDMIHNIVKQFNIKPSIIKP